MSEVLNHILQEIQEGKYKIETDEENLELILHPVLLKVFKKDDKCFFRISERYICDKTNDKPRPLTPAFCNFYVAISLLLLLIKIVITFSMRKILAT